MEDIADYIIAGGGSAGCVLAHRLSEDPRNRVILLEAGGSSDRFWVNLPAGISRNVANPDLNWFHRSEPDPTLNGRSLIWHGGKMLGGGSALNGMVYIRCARSDYDGWAEQGCSGWSWNEVLPYFIRAETFEGEPSQTHGSSGPLGVAPLRVIHPVAKAFIAACDELGIRKVDDYCEGDVDGSFHNLATQRNGRRSSTAASYLAQASNRPNLKVLTGVLVDRVLIEDGRACGVVYRRDGTEHVVRAASEVIVSAGALQSPTILMRSGIGPGGHLQAMGVDVRVESSQVGRNLQDHSSIHNSRLVSVPTYNAIRNPFRLAVEAMNYILFRRGILATAALHAMVTTRSTPETPHPDVRLGVMPFCIDPKTGMQHTKSGIGFSMNNMAPKARGEIRLRSAKPEDKPVIDYRMYEHPEDLAVMRAGMRLSDRLFASPALARYVVGPNFPPTSDELSDAELDDLIRNYSATSYHPVATCRMGKENSAVLDPQLRVRGVGGLRVVDASIMPAVPSGNTNGPTIMIAEKGAEMILSSATA